MPFELAPANATACPLGYAVLLTLGTRMCLECPPHTIGADGLNCVRCPDSSFAAGWCNTQCAPCLDSNMTSDLLACPVIVPTYYLVAASSSGLAVLMAVLLVASLCVLQKRSIVIRAMQIKESLRVAASRLIDTGNFGAADSVAYHAAGAVMTDQNEDDDETAFGLAITDEDGENMVPNVSAVPEVAFTDNIQRYIDDTQRAERESASEEEHKGAQ